MREGGRVEETERREGRLLSIQLLIFPLELISQERNEAQNGKKTSKEYMKIETNEKSKKRGEKRKSKHD